MSRKKVVIAAAVLMLVIFVGGALAYFTDIASKTNVFTIGNVKIDLTEPSWLDTNGIDLTSNAQVAKDPTISNKGASSAYVFLKVEVPYISVTLEGSNSPVSTQLFSYSLNNGWTEIGTANVTGEKIVHVYAYGSSQAMTELAKNGVTPALFNTVQFANIKDPTELTSKNTDIVITAYAIQKENLAVSSPEDIYALFNQ